MERDSPENNFQAWFSKNKPLFIAGPCSMESELITLRVAEKLAKISENQNIDILFKASFDKANRTAISSYRSLGIEQGLKLLSLVKGEFNLSVTTDIHEAWQADEVGEVVDMIQIPALLARQTDLLLAAANTRKPVNVKKGQFMSPAQMGMAKEKVESCGNELFLSTERGTFFGYGDLVVDFRSLVEMRKYGPVVYDVTHSIQRPGLLGTSSGGDSHLGPHLARAAAGIGVDGFFIETHPNPDQALSDGPNMVRLDKLEGFISGLIELDYVARDIRKRG
jgi:2-dehydro-3-deoxyphosphooctonate aldolase (KDO 8-P synthase)